MDKMEKFPTFFLFPPHLSVPIFFLFLAFGKYHMAAKWWRALENKSITSLISVPKVSQKHKLISVWKICNSFSTHSRINCDEFFWNCITCVNGLLNVSGPAAFFWARKWAALGGQGGAGRIYLFIFFNEGRSLQVTSSLPPQRLVPLRAPLRPPPVWRLEGGGGPSGWTKQQISTLALEGGQARRGGEKGPGSHTTLAHMVHDSLKADIKVAPN